MFKNKKNLIIVLLLGALAVLWLPGESPSKKPTYTGTNNVNSPQKTQSTKKIINVKYRTDPVDVNSNHFEYFPTSSSFVNGLWYDQTNQYMIILLKDTYYHYCGLPSAEWRSFKQADSYGTYYNQRIKGNYNCRTGYVPSY